MCMCNSGLTLTPFDPEIESTSRSIRRAVKEATLAQKFLVEDNLLIPSNAEEETIMDTVPPPPTMGNYCKRTDE